MKLTKPQRDLLQNVYDGNRHVSETYQPAKKLVALGLCIWREGKFGSTWLDLTEAGREALAKAREAISDH